MLNKRVIVSLASALLAVAGLSSTVPSIAAWGGGGAVAPLSEDEIVGMKFMREEEKLARDSYLVLGDLWGVPVFGNIAGSEQKHMDAIKKLLDKYQVTDPVTDESDIGSFKDPELQPLYYDLMARGEGSLMAALMVGGEIEETDMQDIQAWIELADHSDIISVYESLMCGSRNHLRAFVKQVEMRGKVYQAQVLTQDEVDAIADSPTERDCGGNRRGGQR